MQVHKSDNGGGSFSYREFCNECGSIICTYEVSGSDCSVVSCADFLQEQAKDHYRLMALGSLDDLTVFEPTGEFYCTQREAWVPKVPGKAQFSKR